MTTLIAVKGAGAIVIGADSRAIRGSLDDVCNLTDGTAKCYAVGRCVIGVVGDSDLAVTLLHEAQSHGHDCWANAYDAARSLSEVCRKRWGEWFGLTKAPLPTVGFLLAGYERTDIPMIYFMHSGKAFVPLVCNPYIVAGVSSYALYLLHRYYDANMSLAEIQALVEYAIAETALEDPKVGTPVRLTLLKPNGEHSEVSDVDMRRIHEQNAARDQQLRKLFTPNAACRPESPAA